MYMNTVSNLLGNSSGRWGRQVNKFRYLSEDNFIIMHPKNVREKGGGGVGYGHLPPI